MGPQQASRVFWIYLIVLGLLCCGLALYATDTLGPGVGTDGAIQVSTADRLLARLLCKALDDTVNA